MTEKNRIIMLSQLWKDEAGVSTVEYALLIAVLVGTGAAMWTALRGSVSSVMAEIAQTFSEGQ